MILDEPTAALGVAQTRAGARPRPAPGRSGLARRADLAQPPRHLRGRRPHHGAAPRPQHRRLRPREDHAAGARRRPSPPGVPTKVSGIPGTGDRGRRREHRSRVEAPPPLEPSGIGSYPRRIMDNLRSGNLGSGPVIVALAADRRRLQPDRRQLLHRVNFNNIILQMAGTTLLAYGVVFVLLIGEIDLSISYVERRRGRRRRQAPAARSGHEYPALIAILAAHRRGRGDRRVPGLDHRADRRSVVRRHARGLRDLAGRGPEVDPAGRDRDPGPDDQRRLPYFFSDTAAGSSPRS